jgi:hypothetical protein
MQLQEIDVYIDANGEVRVEVRGMLDESCLVVTGGLEAALGGEVVSREMTAEASASGEVSETRTRQLGQGG